MPEKQTFHEHIAELRRRLLWVFLAVGVSATIGYNLRAPIIKLLQQPLGKPLFYSSPAGSFNFVMEIAAVVGIFVALPVSVYQILRFIEPALPKRIRKKSMVSVISTSFFLAMAGAAFAFWYIVPTSLKFFGGYSSENVQPLISANEYLRFVVNSLVTFAVIFQIPLIFYFIDRIKPIPPKKILKYQKHTIAGAFLIAVLLPFTYDPITQFIIAIPIIVLFYLSAAILWRTNHKRAKQLARQTITARQAAPKRPLVPATPVPILNIAPSYPQATPSRPRLSIDGFVTTRSQRITVPPQQHRSLVAQTDARPIQEFSTIRPQMKRQRLSMDGIRPLLGAS